jgi:hypothetical protein
MTKHTPATPLPRMTIHGYADTEKKLTREQWDSATTEQRSGFLAEGYALHEYCECGEDHTEEEEIDGICACCGKWI